MTREKGNSTIFLFGTIEACVSLEIPIVVIGFLIRINEMPTKTKTNVNRNRRTFL